ncbi:hypothetical protein L9F63_018583, partial [Diploptera punctata]
ENIGKDRILNVSVQHRVFRCSESRLTWDSSYFSKAKKFCRTTSRRPWNGSDYTE